MNKERLELAVKAFDEENYVEAIKIFQEESDNGCDFSTNRLGVMNEYGLGTEENLQNAKKLYELSAEKGSSFGMYNLGMLYLNGKGVNKDIKQAIIHLRKSSDKGYTLATYNLGAIYKDEKPNHKQAVHYFQKAAEDGYQRAIQNLGLYYYFGEGVEMDMKKALSIFISGYVSANKDDVSLADPDNEAIVSEYERIFRELCGLSESAIKGFVVDGITEISFDARNNNGKISKYTIEF